MNNQGGLSIGPNRYFYTLNRICSKINSMQMKANQKFNTCRNLLQNNVKWIILIWIKIHAKQGQRMQREGRATDKEAETTCIIS